MKYEGMKNTMDSNGKAAGCCPSSIAGFSREDITDNCTCYSTDSEDDAIGAIIRDFKEGRAKFAKEVHLKTLSMKDERTEGIYRLGNVRFLICWLQESK